MVRDDGTGHDYVGNNVPGSSGAQSTSTTPFAAYGADGKAWVFFQALDSTLPSISPAGQGSAQTLRRQLVPAAGRGTGGWGGSAEDAGR